MGLDQTAFVTNQREKVIKEELHYWRKHPNLQGWMEKLWREKNPDESVGIEFNNIDVELTLEDLNKLENDILQEKLPETVGFFFGKSQPFRKDGDLDFVKKAKEEIQKGNKIFYTSCW